MTEPDPLAQLASTAFRAWATMTQASVEATMSVVRQLAEGAYRERAVPIVGEDRIATVGALVGGRLSATPFVWVDKATGAPTNDPDPIFVITPAEIVFDPGTVPKVEKDAVSPFVTIRLHPNHPVRTGFYAGSVLSDGEALPRTYSVYVSGVDR